MIGRRHDRVDGHGVVIGGRDRFLEQRGEDASLGRGQFWRLHETLLHVGGASVCHGHALFAARVTGARRCRFRAGRIGGSATRHGAERPPTDHRSPDAAAPRSGPSMYTTARRPHDAGLIAATQTAVAARRQGTAAARPIAPRHRWTRMAAARRQRRFRSRRVQRRR